MHLTSVSVVLDATLPPGERANILIRDILGPAVPVFEYITHLGDGPVLIAAAIMLYWFGDSDSRRKRAWVLAVGMAAFALAVGIKGFLAAPRPELIFAPEFYPGYSFPSAHAMGAAAFYGALAVSMKLGSTRQRYAIAGLIIVSVAISRVVIGVHFLGDVVIGILLGLLIVFGGRRYRGYDPGPLFALAFIIALAAYVAGSREFTTLTIGASLGGIIGWYFVWHRRTTDQGAAVLVLGTFTLAALAIVYWVLPSVLSYPTFEVLGVTIIGRTVFEIAAYAILTLVMLGLPVAAIYIEDSWLVQRLQATLPFHGRRIEPPASFDD